MANKSRVTVVETVYHQYGDGHTHPVSHQYQRFLQNQDAGYLRLLEVGEEWQQLDSGWIEDASFLHIKNERPRFDRIPDNVQLAAIEAAVVELRMDDSDIPFTEIRPGETIRINPMFIKATMVRCRAGKAKITINVLPE